MGLVRITSWYPNFNGSHFGLRPNEIHRMTGLPPKIVWSMTYLHRQHCGSPTRASFSSWRGSNMVTTLLEVLSQQWCHCDVVFMWHHGDIISSFLMMSFSLVIDAMLNKHSDHAVRLANVTTPLWHHPCFSSLQERLLLKCMMTHRRDTLTCGLAR